MKRSNIAVAVIVSMMSTFSYAGSNGVALTQNQFNDYLVYVTTSAGTCGGQLIAGKYVVTAAHCVAHDYGVAMSDTWNAVPVDGLLTAAQVAAANPKITFGNVNKTAGTVVSVNSVQIHPEYVYRYQHDASARSSYLEQVTTAFMNQTGVTDAQLTYGKPLIVGDIVVFELSTPVLQQSSATLIKSDEAIADKTDITWTGWGATLSNQSATPDVANTGTISYTAYPYSNWTQIIGFNMDIEKATTKNGSNLCSGDSGSPETINGQVIGYESSSTLGCGDINSVTSLTSAPFYLPWLAQQINAVNTVGKKELVVTSAGTQSVTWTIPVQNLKTTDETFTPELVDSTGLFTSNNLSNCEGTFATGSSCEISVTFNAAGAQVANNATATLKLNSEVSIPLSYLIQTPTPTTNTGSSSGGSSGGGSTSPSLLAGMLALLLVRRIKCRA